MQTIALAPLRPRPPRFVIRRAVSRGRKGFRVRIVGANGAIVFGGEFYTRLPNARHACAIVNPRLAVEIVR